MTTNNVDTKHKDYTEREKDWKMINDIKAGERVMKEAKTEYVPKLEGQNAEQYKRYIARGSFYNGFARTVQGMTGSILRKPAEVEVPKEMNDYLENITVSNNSFTELSRTVSSEVLSTGRYGLLVDMPISNENNKEKPYIAPYDALNILNWRSDRIDGKDKLTFLVLREYLEIPNTEDSVFKTDEVTQIRVFRLIAIDESGNDEESVNGQLVVDVYKENTNYKGKNDTRWNFDSTYEPKKMGKRLTEIPFVFINALDSSPTPSAPPLLDLAFLNVSHWRLTVDHHHGLHFTALPTAWAAGFPVSKEGNLKIGSLTAWVSKDNKARCGFLEFSGEGLGAIKKEITDTESQMASMGGRLLREPKKGVEAAETARINQTADSVSLTTIANSISSGLTQALRYVAFWMNYNENKVNVQMNTDFIDTKLSPQDITALLQSYQRDAISLDTFLYNLKAGEVLPPHRTEDEEKELIVSEKDEPFKKDPGLVLEDDDLDIEEDEE